MTVPNPTAPILLACAFGPDEWAAWLPALQAALPGVDLIRPEAPHDPETIQVAIVANPAPGVLQRYPRLRWVQSLWAGVDRLLGDMTLPPQVMLTRMVDPAMNLAMAETATWAVLSAHRDFFHYARQQQQGHWHQRPQRRADEVRVGVLGQGQMGHTTTERLRSLGYPVRGWRRGDDLGAVLANSDVLINLLPLTPDTRGLINRHTLAQLPAGATLVNLARGGHVVTDDVLAALDSGQLAQAVLDVFDHEPLPAEHPLWHHPRVTVLPHVAAQTDPRSAAQVVAAQWQAWCQGSPLAHGVERVRGY